MSSSMEDVGEFTVEEYLQLLLAELRDKPITRMDPMTSNILITRALAVSLERSAPGYYFQAVCKWVGDDPYTQVLTPFSWNIHPIGCKCKGEFCLMGVVSEVVGSSGRVIVGSIVPRAPGETAVGSLSTSFYTPEVKATPRAAAAPVAAAAASAVAVRAPPQASVYASVPDAAASSSRAPAAVRAPYTHPALDYFKDARDLESAWESRPNVNSKAEVDRCVHVVEVLFGRTPLTLEPLTYNLEATKEVAKQLEKRGLYLHAIFQWRDAARKDRMYPIRWNIHEIGCLCLGTFCVMGVVAGMPQHSNRIVVGSNVPVATMDIGPRAPRDNRVTHAMLIESGVDPSAPAATAIRAPPQASFYAPAPAMAAASAGAVLAPPQALFRAPPPAREHPAKGYFDDISNPKASSIPAVNWTAFTQLYLDLLFAIWKQPESRSSYAPLKNELTGYPYDSKLPYRCAPLTKNLDDTRKLAALVEENTKWYLQVIAKWDNRSRTPIPISWNVHEKDCRCVGSSCVAGVVAGMTMPGDLAILGSKVPPARLTQSREDRVTADLLQKRA